jgi:hypothetical protein
VPLLRVPARLLRAILLTAVFAACCGLLAPATAHADQQLTVSPLLMNLAGAAGDELIESIAVTASGSDPITVELVHADFGFDDDYQVVLINDSAKETTAFSTRDWFSLPKPRYRIPAGQSRDLPLRISVPPNTPGGTYLGAALLRVVPPDDAAGGSQVQAVAQTGSLVFIAVEGGDPPRPKIDAFSVSSLTTRGPITPKLVVRNDGDEYFTLEGNVKLTGPGTDETVDVRRQYVVPDEPREVRAGAKDASKDAGPIMLGSKQLGFGRYTVSTRLRVEPTGTTLLAERTIWVIPVWARLLGLGLLIVLIALIVLLARRFGGRSAAPELDDPGSIDEESLDDEQLDEMSLDEESLDEDSLDDHLDA